MVELFKKGGNRQFNTPYLYTRPTSPGAAGDTDRRKL